MEQYEMMIIKSRSNPNGFQPYFIRKAIKSVADPLGFGNPLRKAFVEVNHLGEFIQQVVRGSPKPSDAILLAGSGRSGTTWLEGLICKIAKAQPIFEPLWEPGNPLIRRLTGWGILENETNNRAFYLSEDNSSEDWKKFWLDILTGKYRTYWTDYERHYFFPKCYLIKEIRANMMLGFIYKNFKPRIVLLVRHPCAVIASRLKVSWYANVKDILQQEELVENHLRPWVHLIEKEKDLVGAHAVWWAVENMIAIQQLSSYPHQLMFYEETVTQTNKVTNQLTEWLGGRELLHKVEKIARRPSRTTDRKQRQFVVEQLLYGWQNTLSSEDQRRIIHWARVLGIEWYDLSAVSRLEMCEENN
jgi:hypothetical protein